MKKLLLFTLISGVFLFSCKDDEAVTNGGGSGEGSTEITVAEKQKTSVLYHTATWCGPCGVYGHPAFNSMRDGTEDDELVALLVHAAGNSNLVPTWNNPDSANRPYVQGFMIDLRTTLPFGNSIPSFVVDGKFAGTSTVSAPNIIAQAKNTAENTSPVANMNGRATIDGNTVKIETKTKFFQDAPGDYYLSVLLIEKEVVAAQAGASGGISTHHNLIRGSAHGFNNLLGQSIVSSASAGDVIDGSYTYNHVLTTDLPAQYLQWQKPESGKTSVALILWKDQTGSPLEIVNTTIFDAE